MTDHGPRAAARGILFVAPSLPYPPDKGEKIRAFHQLREIARRHRVHLVCGLEEGHDPVGLTVLAKFCASVRAVPIRRVTARLRAIRGLLTGSSRSAHFHSSAGLRREVARALSSERVDVVLASSVSVVECVRRVDSIPKAVDFVDVDSEFWSMTAPCRAFPQSWLYRLEARRLARYETDVARSFDCAIFVSEAEARIFRRRTTEVPVAVVGNGVDLDAFTPVPRDPAPREGHEIVFTGTMDYFPNVDAVRYFCESIFGGVRAAVPQVRFTIVGRNPTRAVRKLGRDPNVTVTGWVPDVRPHLARATIAVAPLRIARGVQNKILEALASGVPVVATSEATQGLEVTDADGVRRTDDPESFSREVVRLLLDPAWRARNARQGRGFVERCHRWDVHGGCLSRLLETLVEKRGAGRSPTS